MAFKQVLVAILGEGRAGRPREGQHVGPDMRWWAGSEGSGSSACRSDERREPRMGGQVWVLAGAGSVWPLHTETRPGDGRRPFGTRGCRSSQDRLEVKLIVLWAEGTVFQQ